MWKEDPSLCIILLLPSQFHCFYQSWQTWVGLICFKGWHVGWFGNTIIAMHLRNFVRIFVVVRVENSYHFHDVMASEYDCFGFVSPTGDWSLLCTQNWDSGFIPTKMSPTLCAPRLHLQQMGWFSDLFLNCAAVMWVQLWNFGNICSWLFLKAKSVG